MADKPLNVVPEPGSEPQLPSETLAGATVPLARAGRSAAILVPGGGGPTLMPAAPERLGPYRLLRQLGRGGMGLVYLAEDERLRRPVALKVIHPQLAAQPEARERFLREARAAAAVRHPNVVTIYEVNEAAFTPFIVMEYLRGASLERYLERKGPPEVGHILRIGREVAAGLLAAHDQGLVHRDIKPANVWLESPRGQVKLLDFGLARLDHEETKLTGVGEVMGTPAYMAPEQARGLRVDHRADLYSLGAVLYALCTGRPPFRGPTVMSVLTALAVDRPEPVRSVNPNIPPALAELAERLLAKRPDDRPASARDVILELRAVEKLLAAGAGGPATSLAPMNVEAETIAPLSGRDPDADAPTEPIPEPRRKRRRRRARKEEGWQRLVIWLVSGLSLLLACLIGIRAATRPRPAEPVPDATAATEPAEKAPQPVEKAVPRQEPARPVQPVTTPEPRGGEETPEPRRGPPPEEFRPMPPPPKGDFPPPPFPPPKKDLFR